MCHARITSARCSDSMIFTRKDDKDACSKSDPAGCHGINSRSSVRILASECPAMALGWTAERRRSSVCCRHSRSIRATERKSKPRQLLFDSAAESPGCAGTNQSSCEDLLRKHFSTGGDGILHTDTSDDFIVKSRVGTEEMGQMGCCAKSHRLGFVKSTTSSSPRLALTLSLSSRPVLQ